MFLSFIVPVYNSERYLSECLDSLLCQDIPETDYQIVVVNDGSTDHSEDIICRYEATFSNVVHVNQNNSGVSVARNTGMESATGDYIWFVDSDDFIQENCLNKLKEICARTACDCLSFRLFYFNDKDALSIKEQMREGKALYSNSSVRSQQCMLFRRDLIGNLRWHPGIEVGEDALFLRELALQQYSLVEIEDVLYFYRQLNNSAIHHAGNQSRRMFSHVKAARIMKGIYESDGGKCEANANYLRMFVIYAMVSIARCQGKERSTALSMMKKEKLFPFKVPKESTSKNNFHTTRNDVFGKFYGFLCNHSFSRIGFFILCLYYRLFDKIRG